MYLRSTPRGYRKQSDNRHTEKQTSTSGVWYCFVAWIVKIYLCSQTSKSSASRQLQPYVCLHLQTFSPVCLLLLSLFSAPISSPAFTRTALLLAPGCALVKDFSEVCPSHRSNPIWGSVVSVTCVHLCCTNIMSRLMELIVAYWFNCSIPLLTSYNL